MKTDTILLQNFDNIDSVLDKLKQVMLAENSATRILLVWPKRGRLLEDGLEFARVRNFACRRGVQVAIIPNSEAVRVLALEQSLPVFDERRTAENTDWKERGSSLLPMKRGKRVQRMVDLRESLERAQPQVVPRTAELLLFFIALGVSVFVLYLLIPHAKVHISPVRTERRTELSLWTNDSVNSVTMNGGVPSQEEVLTLELAVTVKASGRVSSLAAMADGETTREYVAPSTGDYQEALTQIAAQVPVAAEEKIRARYGDVRTMLEDSVRVLSITQEQITPDFGYASEWLSVRQTLEVSVRTLLNADVDVLVKSLLSLSNEEEELSDVVTTGQIMLSPPQEKDGIISWRVAVDQSGYQLKTSEDAVRTLLKGKEMGKARQILENIPHDGTPVVELWPGWIGRMPLLPGNISVICDKE